MILQHPKEKKYGGLSSANFTALFFINFMYTMHCKTYFDLFFALWNNLYTHCWSLYGYKKIYSKIHTISKPRAYHFSFLHFIFFTTFTIPKPVRYSNQQWKGSRKGTWVKLKIIITFRETICLKNREICHRNISHWLKIFESDHGF